MFDKNPKFPINGNLLRDAILEKFNSVGDAGDAIGYSRSAYSNPIQRGEITLKLKIAAETILGIPYDVYAAEIPTPATPMEGRRRKSSKEPCVYCGDDCAMFIDASVYKFNSYVAILPKRKVLELNVAFGENDAVSNILSERAFINFCPYCGRAL